MGANNHKVVNAINVIQSLPDRVVGSAQTLKAMFDNVGEIVRLKHNALCDYIDTDIATKAEVQGVTLGQIADGTITTAKLDPNALQANVTKIGAGNITAYGVGNVDASLDKLRRAIYYGKYSQMSGGDAKPSGSVNAILSFSTEDNDDFSAINIGANPSRITIPSGISKARFYWKGSIPINGFPADGNVTVSLFKNGTLKEVLNSTNTKFHGTNYSLPMNVVAGDYFDVRVSVGSQTYEISAGSVFGMEVMG